MTKGIYRKLIAAAFLALISISLMVTVSYAWYTLAGSPALAGVQITIGGTNTIKIAPDIAVEVDGETVHYPGAFEETLNISQHASYDYLSGMAGLRPVSTADGIHWFLPNTEEERIDAQLEDLEGFIMDDALAYANVAEDDEKADTGNYAYLDFWVVSPLDNCELRVAGGYEGTGSYLVSLPKVVVSEDGTYSLEEDGNEAAASARIGFMTNTLTVTDMSMLHYAASSDYNELYKHLEGTLMEPGLNASGMADYYDFTIYEPNGDLHTGEGIAYMQTAQGLVMNVCEDGSYVMTSPIGMANGERTLMNISPRLCVQKTNNWIRTAENNLYLNEKFQAYLIGAGDKLQGKSEEAVAQGFYEEYLQKQYAGYVESVQFFEDTNKLYYADQTNSVSPEKLAGLETAGAVEDAVIVTLKKNVPTRIRMFVWLEGQDIDCVREAAAETIAIGIELAGSTQN